MSPSAAFVPLGASSFTSALPARPEVCSAPARAPVTPVAMADKKRWFSIPNPFAKKKGQQSGGGVAPSGFAELQPGDPGYVPRKDEKFEFEEAGPVGPPSKIKAKAEAEAAEKKAGEDAAKEKEDAKGKIASAFKTIKTKLPVASGTADVESKKRGLDLLRQDFLKSAPERAGIGRQDVTAVMAPSFGEPGYKPQAFETVKLSELGISPFQDDANAVGKVGGLAAVQKAALASKRGKTAKQNKAKALKKPIVVSAEDIVYDIPDYLKPIPEDTTTKGLTWKNYNGR